MAAAAPVQREAICCWAAATASRTDASRRCSRRRADVLWIRCRVLATSSASRLTAAAEVRSIPAEEGRDRFCWWNVCAELLFLGPAVFGRAICTAVTAGTVAVVAGTVSPPLIS